MSDDNPTPEQVAFTHIMAEVMSEIGGQSGFDEALADGAPNE